MYFLMNKLFVRFLWPLRLENGDTKVQNQALYLYWDTNLSHIKINVYMEYYSAATPAHFQCPQEYKYVDFKCF